MTVLQLTRPLAVIDLETTGVDPVKDRIIQLGIIVIAQDGQQQEHHFLVNPGMPIPAEASAVHHITDDLVADQPTFAEVAPVVASILLGVDVAGFNVKSFDWPMLLAEFERAGVGPKRFASAKVIDAYRIFGRQEPRDLTAAARWYLDRAHEGAHDAMADVRMTINVLEAQARKYGATTLEQLDAASRDPSWIDSEGKIRWEGDHAVINFGRWLGRPLAQVDRGYLQWMLSGSFPDDTKAIVKNALSGSFPARGGK